MTSVLCIVFSLPSVIATIMLANQKTFKLCLFNVSMCFFFFSFHVHEKTILIPLLALGLSIRYFGEYYLDFVTYASMTMFYLFRYDLMDFQYFVSTVFFFYFCHRMLKFLHEVRFLKNFWKRKNEVVQNKNSDLVANKINEEKIAQNSIKLIRFIDKLYFKLIRVVFYFLIIVFHIAERYVTPPAHLPALWFWFIDILAFFVFVIIWVRCNILLIYMVAKQKAKERKAEKKID